MERSIPTSGQPSNVNLYGWTRIIFGYAEPPGTRRAQSSKQTAIIAPIPMGLDSLIINLSEEHGKIVRSSQANKRYMSRPSSAIIQHSEANGAIVGLARTALPICTRPSSNDLIPTAIGYNRDISREFSVEQET